MSEASGRLRVTVPSQLPLPAAFVEIRLMTHVLVAWLVVLGMASGGPKRQPGLPGYSGLLTPAELQWRFGCTLPETSAVAVGAMLKLPAEQAVRLVYVPPKPLASSSVFGTSDGSGTPTPAPPK